MLHAPFAKNHSKILNLLYKFLYNLSKVKHQNKI